MHMAKGLAGVEELVKSVGKKCREKSCPLLPALSIDEENDLVNRAAQKDKKALSRLIKVYTPLLKKASTTPLLRRLGLCEEARAIAQLYFIESVQKFDARRDATFAAYVKARVYGGVSTFIAAEKRRREREYLINEKEETTLETLAGADTKNPYAQVDLREYLRVAVRALSQKEKSLLHLLFVEDYTVTQAAKLLGICRQNATRLKERLLSKLRRQLTPNLAKGTL